MTASITDLVPARRAHHRVMVGLDDVRRPRPGQRVFVVSDSESPGIRAEAAATERTISRVRFIRFY